MLDWWVRYSGGAGLPWESAAKARRVAPSRSAVFFNMWRSISRRDGCATIARKMQESRRQSLKSAGLGAAALALPAVLAQKKRPNILILFTDDQRFSTLNALNNPEVRTPNMDRLMRQDATFSHTFVIDASAHQLY